MSLIRVQAAIVGGGPAGSAAAYTLAAAGIRTCLVDRSVFPRDKLCGGLLTIRSQRAFQHIFKTDWSEVIETTSRGVQFFYRDRLLNRIDDYKEVFFTSRRVYDAFLLNLARQRGAMVLEGEAVKDVDFEQSMLRLARGTRIRYDYLIGADGVHSIVAKTILGKSFDPNNVGFGVESEIPLSPTLSAVEHPEIYFGLVKWGYGWIFPKRDSLTVGVGGLLKANPEIRKSFEQFLRRRFGEIPQQPIKGHFIPFGGVVPRPGRGNVLLCGDAAGLVEPITGEGIAFAMLSGYKAAKSVVDTLHHPHGMPCLASYEKRYTPIVQSFRQANLLRNLLFPQPFQYLFSRILPRSQSIPRRHMDLMAGDLSYSQYGWFLLRKALSAPLKIF